MSVKEELFTKIEEIDHLAAEGETEKLNKMLADYDKEFKTALSRYEGAKRVYNAFVSDPDEVGWDFPMFFVDEDDMSLEEQVEISRMVEHDDLWGTVVTSKGYVLYVRCILAHIKGALSLPRFPSFAEEIETGDLAV